MGICLIQEREKKKKKKHCYSVLTVTVNAVQQRFKHVLKSVKIIKSYYILIVYILYVYNSVCILNFDETQDLHSLRHFFQVSTDFCLLFQLFNILLKT